MYNKKNIWVLIVLLSVLFGCSNNEYNSKLKEKEYLRIELIKELNSIECVTEYDDDTEVKYIDTIKFGKFDLDIQNNNYEEYGHPGIEDIEWIVLEKNQNRALLFSKHPVQYMGHSNQADDFVYWSNSDIRTWLNDEFYNTAFSDIEKNFINETTLTTQTNMYGKPYKEEITIDRLFLISQQDCLKYFNANHDDFNIKIRTAEYDYRGYGYGRGTDFWTRTPYEFDGKDIYHTYDAYEISYADVTSHGLVESGYLPLPMCIGVRPAMWISYDAE